MSSDRTDAPKRVLLAVLALALVLLAWLPWTQQAGVASAREGLKRALVTYASVRAIDAAISVAKQTEVTLQPGGVGPGFGVGRALEPLDDLIEQFSSLMQWVLVAFGLQIMLANLGAHAAVSLLLTLALTGVIVLAWQRRAVPQWLKRAALALLIVRFAVPLYAVSGEALHQHVLSAQYRTAQVALDRARDLSAVAAPEPAPAKPPGWFARWLPDWASKVELPRLPDLEGMTQRIELRIERLIELAVLLLFETVAMPLAFFVFLRIAWRSATSRGVGAEAPH